MPSVLFFDGACHGNPGPVGAGVALHVDAHAPVVESHGFGFDATNNVAEYLALIRGLELALDQGVERLEVRGDSQLVIRQVTGAWRCRQPHLRPLRDRARELRDRFERVRFTWVDRGSNERADEAALQGVEDSKGRDRTPWERRKKELAGSA